MIQLIDNKKDKFQKLHLSNKLVFQDLNWFCLFNKDFSYKLITIFWSNQTGTGTTTSSSTTNVTRLSSSSQTATGTTVSGSTTISSGMIL